MFCCDKDTAVYAGDCYDYDTSRRHVRFISSGVSAVSCASPWALVYLNIVALILELVFVGVACTLVYHIIGQGGTGGFTIVLCILGLLTRAPHFLNSMRAYTRNSNQWHRANVVTPLFCIIGYVLMFMSCLNVVTIRRTGVDIWFLIMTETMRGSWHSVALLILIVLLALLFIAFALMSLIHYKNTTAIIGPAAYHVLVQNYDSMMKAPSSSGHTPYIDPGEETDTQEIVVGSATQRSGETTFRTIAMD